MRGTSTLGLPLPALKTAHRSSRRPSRISRGVPGRPGWSEPGTGNDGASAVCYPAAYDDYCIAVGATRFDQTRAFYSNTGNHIDIVAPGGDTHIDQNGDGSPDGILQQTFDEDPSVFAYYFAEGTSSATPHVSGAAALLISGGVTDPDMVREALEQTA